MTNRNKLIEVALPLDAINKASAREKSIRHGHPSTLHLWWARRPLAAARAVIFAQMVDDPSSCPDLFPTEKAQEKERQRLFKIIEELVQWENTTNEAVLERARAEMWQSWRRACAENVDHPRAKELFNRNKLPAFHDPFAGGGSLPLEAQRLGLETYATDLNPVAVLINKAMIEMPPKFAGRPPVNPEARKAMALLQRQWRGAQGLAEDVRYYGNWIRSEAEKRIGHLYPSVTLPKEYGGRRAAVIALVWARTIACPNPACGGMSPISKTFQLSGKRGGEAYAEIKVERAQKKVRFSVRHGKDRNSEGNVTRTGARCLLCENPISLDHIRHEASNGRMGQQLLAIVAEGDRRRVYLSADETQEAAALKGATEMSAWMPSTELPEQALGFRVQRYGMKTHAQLFSARQLLALSTFADVVRQVPAAVAADADGDAAYGAAVATYLAFAVDKAANYWSALCTWYVDREIMVSTFGLPTLSMAWDFAEANPFSSSSGNWLLGVEQAASAIEGLPSAPGKGTAIQADAIAGLTDDAGAPLIATDPPYYDNIGYAALSDFFYIWLRRTVGHLYPDLFGTVLTPKSAELIAEPGRFGGDRKQAIKHFEDGLSQTFERIRDAGNPAFPTCVFYAFKQQEQRDDGNGTSVVSSGWETMLTALIGAGFLVCGTWPIRTEQTGGLRESKRNALASSIVLVCRRRPESARVATRRDFIGALKQDLPPALRALQKGNIAPVDLAQSAIGPGMAVFSRYARVLDTNGQPLRVREALAIINEVLDLVLAEQEGDFDADTRWALAWFDQNGFSEEKFGEAETLSKAKNTSVGGLVSAGIVTSKSGRVRLLCPDELPKTWNPAADQRLTVWETVHHLIRVLEAGGENAAAELVAKLGSKSEVARELAYRLYTICERKKRAAEALSYNGLVQSWPEIIRLAREAAAPRAQQAQLFGEV